MRCMQSASARFVLAPILAALLVSVPLGCGYSNPHGYQDTPPITRLTTVPAGATVIIEDMNLMLETPCDLPTELDPDDTISISKQGYVPFKGPLSDLWEVTRGNYHLKMQPLGSPPPPQE